MNNNHNVMTDEQYQFCINEANSLAKILLDKDVENVFGDIGNANFVLEVLVILTTITVSVLAEKINMNPLDFLNAFHEQAWHTLKRNEKKPNLRLIQ